MYGDCEAVGSKDRDVACIVSFQGDPVSFTTTVNVNAQIGDICGKILGHGSVPPEARGAKLNIWRAFLVDGDDRQLLDNNLVLTERDDWDCLLLGGHLELVDDGPQFPQAGAGVVPVNIWPLPVIVINRNGQVVAKFTKDCNVTLPAQSIIDCILQDEVNIPQEVRTSVEPWQLFLVHEESGVEKAIPEKETLRSIADNDVLADHVHLKVAIID